MPTTRIDSLDGQDQTYLQNQHEVPMRLTAVGTVAAMLIAVCVSQSQSTSTGSTPAPEAAVKPLLLEKNEGEQRIWRDPPPGGFMLKVSPENNGSQHLVLLTEDLLPGDVIPTHKHLGQDEILLIQTGIVHVRLGDKERDLHAGGMVFIPAYTWVSVKNNGTEAASIVGIFSAPGFEDHLRCVSVHANEKPTPTTPEEKKQCDHEGHVVYAGPEENSKK
jgi:quercetin dioxygenase-like cupin family protein